MSSRPGSSACKRPLPVLTAALFPPPSLILISINSLLAKVLHVCQSYIGLLLGRLFAVSTS